MDLLLNGRRQPLPEDLADPQMPLLWALRDLLDATGSKLGCGRGHCGACTVLVGDAAVRACQLPLAALDGRAVTTVEGLEADPIGRAVQAAWLDEQVVQCGYCQPGMLVAATALLRRKPAPDDAAIAAAMDQVCRCGTTLRIRRAVHRAAAALAAARGRR